MIAFAMADSDAGEGLPSQFARLRAARIEAAISNRRLRPSSSMSGKDNSFAFCSLAGGNDKGRSHAIARSGLGIKGEGRFRTTFPLGEFNPPREMWRTAYASARIGRKQRAKAPQHNVVLGSELVIGD